MLGDKDNFLKMRASAAPARCNETYMSVLNFWRETQLSMNNSESIDGMSAGKELTMKLSTGS